MFPKGGQIEKGQQEAKIWNKRHWGGMPVPTKCPAVIIGHRKLWWVQLTALGGLGSARHRDKEGQPLGAPGNQFAGKLSLLKPL